HQGGIVDGVDSGPDTTDAELESYALGQFARTYYPLAPPGRIWNYSNPNYSIAGLLDQTLDGRNWPDIIEQDLLPELGMTRTVARRSEVDGDYALGFTSAGADATAVGETWGAAFSRPAGLV